MTLVRVIEAYYGVGVVLDYDDAESKDDAFRAALMTIARSEGRPLADLVLRRVQDDEVVARAASRDELLPALREFLTLLWRYCDFEVTIAGGRPYAFNHLGESDGFSFGPAWKAPDAFYDELWENLREAGRELGQVVHFPAHP